MKTIFQAFWFCLSAFFLVNVHAADQVTHDDFITADELISIMNQREKPIWLYMPACDLQQDLHARAHACEIVVMGLDRKHTAIIYLSALDYFDLRSRCLRHHSSCPWQIEIDEQTLHIPARPQLDFPKTKMSREQKLQNRQFRKNNKGFKGRAPHR